MTLSELFSTRHLSAKLGLLAAAGTSLFLVLKLLDASGPAPTAVHLINAAPTAAALVSLQLGGKEVGAGSMLMPGKAERGPAAEWVSKRVDMEPGRPVEVKVMLAAAPAARVCTLEARPQGQCLVKARLEGNAGLVCEFDCRAEALR